MSTASKALEAAREAFVNDEKGPSAYVIYSEVTKVLLEREMLLTALESLWASIEDCVDIAEHGGPNWAMRLTTNHRHQVEEALERAKR